MIMPTIGSQPEVLGAVAQPAAQYRTCIRCVMDTSHKGIIFDADGVCNFCHNFEALMQKRVTPEQARKKLDESLRAMKEAGRGRDYDCILGLSGGVDSSYLAYKLKQWGVRP